ncbi:MAG: hypothetical protein AAF800_12095 [Planctomycetota bacterium]
MSHHAPKHLTERDTAVLGEAVWPLRRNLWIIGGVALLLAVVAAALPVFEGGWQRLGFAYLIAFCYALAIALGCLFFVLITTLFRAGWCTAFRRLPETIAASMPTLGMLAIPILVMAFVGSPNGYVYPWSQDGIHAYGKKMAAHNTYADEEKAGEKDDHAEGHAKGEARMKAPTFVNLLAAAEAVEADEAHGHGDDHHGDDHHAWTHTAGSWPAHAHATPYYTYKKASWLTPGFFSFRLVLYLAVWSLIGWFYWSRSVKQDADGDLEHTHRRQWWAPLSVIAFALTVTAASFDLVMSLDPAWYSTMFGVYYFAGAFTLAICTMIVVMMLGQRVGYFPAINTEHFHDLGKLLFAFVFFWGYVAFSQFVLIWYASFPETTYWFEIRGVTSVSGDFGGSPPADVEGNGTFDAAPPTFGGMWTVSAWTLLFAHLLLPFAILLSKHVKRNRVALFSMACWMLVLCYIDLHWVIMPAFSSPEFYLSVPEIGCVVFCVCILLAESARRAAGASLTAKNDPRLHESLALDTTAWAPLHTH